MPCRRLFTCSSVALLAAGLAGTATAGDPATGPDAFEPVVVRRVTAPGGAVPLAVAGVLSAPSSRPAADIARDWLAAGPAELPGLDGAELRVQRVSRLARGGALVRFVQVYAGLDVVGPTVAVRIDARGRVRWARSSTARLPAGLDVTPTLSAQDAVAAVLAGPAAHQGPVPIDPERHARLVIRAPAGQPPHLAWLVMVPRNLRFMETLRVYVDAHTGRVLTVENRVRNARQANVFEFNPVSSPDQIVTELSLPEGATQLIGDDVQVHNCIDRGNCMTVDSPYGEIAVHFCDTEPTAAADADGDFLHYLRPELDTEAEDAFAEVQMYYHVTKGYEAFRAWGFTQLNARPLTAVVNLRIPPMDMSGMCTGPTSDGPLYPFDNAAFMPAGTLYGFPPDDSIVFGQGTDIDFSYDGDVVYHEFTHAVMGTLTPLGHLAPDAAGLDTTTGGLHEGYADYFSSAIAGEPEQGEYAGSAFADNPLPSGAIRTLANDKVCPDDLIGESHEDSQPWSGGLWELRGALADLGHPLGDVDAALYAVLGSLGELDTFTEAYAGTVAEIATALGEEAADLATAILEARGLNGCNGRVVVVRPDYLKPELVLYGNDMVDASTVPGPVQFALELDTPAEDVTVDVAGHQLMGYGFGGSTAVKVLVKPGAEPIGWTWTSRSAAHDAPTEVTLPLSASGGTVTIPGEFPAGLVHLQLVNAGTSLLLDGVTITATLAPVEPPVDGGTGDDGDDAADGGPEAGGGSGVSSGCGCSTSGATAPSAWVLLPALMLVLRRRRRAVR